MKWSIDWFLNRFYIFVRQLSFIFSRLLLNFLSKPLDLLLRAISAFVVFLFFVFNSLFSFSTFSFKFFFNILFKPLFVLLSGVIDGFFFNYKPVTRTTSFILHLSYLLFGNLGRLFNPIFNYFYKSIIDFFFFDIPRSIDKIKSLSFFLLKVFMYLVLVYFLLYKNIWGNVFNYFFSDFLESFIVWDVTTYYGVLYIYLTFLNIDNLFLLLYILFTKVGLSFIISHNWSEIFVLFWSFWEYFYFEFEKLNIFCLINQKLKFRRRTIIGLLSKYF